MNPGDLRKRLKYARKLRLYGLYNKYRYPKRRFIEKTYLKRTGRRLDLENPLRMTEKLQWMKLNYRDPLYTQCADKLAVRDYVAGRGHGEILNELYGVYDTPREIVPGNLPERFVLKATHGSGWNLICPDRERLRANWKLCRKLLDQWLRQDYSLVGGEYHYSGIPPRIICEKFLAPSSGGEIPDYKFFCFDGVPRIIQMDYNRFSGHLRNYHDTDWNLLNFNTIPRKNKLPAEPRPENLDRMLQISSDLSQGFPHVRVDLYSVDSKIFFGEMTFTDGNGHYMYEPDSADFMLGEMFRLPEICK